MDVSQAARRLLEDRTSMDSAVPPAGATSEKQLRALDEVATERLLAAGGAGMEVRRKILAGKNAADPIR